MFPLPYCTIGCSVFTLSLQEHTNTHTPRAECRAAAVRDQVKRVQYENSDLLGYAFVPMTFGRLGKPAMALLNKLAECALSGGVVFKDGCVVIALRELSFGLCRGNCMLYNRSLYALARVRMVVRMFSFPFY